jgi:hypothetical protein
MAENIVDTIKKRVQGLTGKSGSAPLGFSGADMVPIMDRIKGTSSVFKAKGVMGVLSSVTKGERPIMSKMAPGFIKKPAPSSARDMPLLKRLPAYQQDSGTSIPELGRKGGTQIGSLGN